MQFFFAARIHYSGYHSSLSFELACWQRMGKAVGDFGEGGQFPGHVWAEQFGGETPAPVPVWAAGGVHARIAARPSASCSGTTQRLATELEAARIMAQLTRLHNGPSTPQLVHARNP